MTTPPRTTEQSRFESDDVRLGNVNGVFGTAGEVRLFLYNPQTDLFDDPREVTLVGPDGARRRVRLVVRPGAGRRLLGAIDGIADPEAAASLVGFEVVVPRSALPATGEDSWYHRDLLGVPVETASGRQLGELAEIYASGGVDVWVVRRRGAEHYIPALRENLVSVEPGVRIVVTDEAAAEPL